MQEKLRKDVKIIKALQGITYTEMANDLEISRSAFYNWLNGQYSLSQEKEKRLIEIIELIKEV